MLSIKTIKTWYWIHKWSSLLCTTFFLLFCLTGLLLIFRRELDHWLGDADERTLYRYPYGYREELERLGVDSALEARFTTGLMQHHLLFGVDYYYNYSGSTTRQIDYADFPGSYPAIDLFKPQ